MRNKKLLAHQHRIELPSGEVVYTDRDWLVPNPCAAPSRGEYDPMGDDDELGFLGALLPIAAAVAPAIMGAFGGDDKKGPAIPPAGASASDIISNLAENVASIDEVKSVVRDLLVSVPPPVKQQVLEVIKAVQAEGGSFKAAEDKLVKNIEAKFMPAVTGALDALKLAQTQRVATSEHNTIARDASRWDTNAKRQKDIIGKQKKIAAQMGRLEEIVSNALENNKLLSPRAVKFAGGNRHLDILAGKR